MIFMPDGAHIWMRILHIFWHLTNLISVLGCTTLPQVHMRNTSMAIGPRISGCIWVHVQSDITKLVDP